MDPLSIAASVAGLITLADIVIDRTYKTIITCKNAGKDAQRLLQETTSLLGILKSLDALSQHVSPAQMQTNLPVEQVKACQATLEQIRGKLEKASPTGQKPIAKFTRTLLWPVTKTETDKFLDEMDRYKITFNLSLSVDVLNKVFESSQAELQIGLDVQGVQSSLAKLYGVVMDEKKQKLLSSVGAFDAEGTHCMNVYLRQAGTGQWLLASTDFEQWLNNRGSKLWCCGMPGAGKSVLAALSVEETLKSANSSHAVTYYYCDYKHAESQVLSKILSCLCGQLARQHAKCFDWLQAEASCKLFASDPARTSELLIRMIKTFEDVSIIIDGLDECEDQLAVVSG